MSDTYNLSGEHVVICDEEGGSVLLDMQPQGDIEIEYFETKVFGVGFGEGHTKMVHVVARQPMTCEVHLDAALTLPPPDHDAIVIVSPEQWADIVQCKALYWPTSDGGTTRIEDPASMWRIVAPEHRRHVTEKTPEGLIRITRTYFLALRGQP